MAEKPVTDLNGPSHTVMSSSLTTPPSGLDSLASNAQVVVLGGDYLDGPPPMPALKPGTRIVVVPDLHIADFGTRRRGGSFGLSAEILAARGFRREVLPEGPKLGSLSLSPGQPRRVGGKKK